MDAVWTEVDEIIQKVGKIHTYWPCFTSCSSVHVQYGMHLQLTSIVVGHLIVLFHFLFRALKVTLEPLKCRCSMDGMDIVSKVGSKLEKKKLPERESKKIKKGKKKNTKEPRK